MKEIGRPVEWIHKEGDTASGELSVRRQLFTDDRRVWEISVDNIRNCVLCPSIDVGDEIRDALVLPLELVQGQGAFADDDTGGFGREKSDIQQRLMCHRAVAM